jgi:hypothetical protein
MRQRNRKPPLRWRECEGESKPTAAILNPPLASSKHFDPVEMKLSFTLDALLDAIDSYREARR